MTHTPFGYRIENGKAVIDETAAERVRSLFASYLSGDSLDTASKISGIQSSHGGIGRILQNTRYLGDEYYPALIDSDTFAAVQGERLRRAKMLGRVYESKDVETVIFPTHFRMNESTQSLEDPFRQAEYIYSLIEMEVSENGCK